MDEPLLVCKGGNPLFIDYIFPEAVVSGTPIAVTSTTGALLDGILIPHVSQEAGKECALSIEGGIYEASFEKAVEPFCRLYWNAALGQVTTDNTGVYAGVSISPFGTGANQLGLFLHGMCPATGL